MKRRLPALGFTMLALASSITLASAAPPAASRMLPQRASVPAAAAGPQHRFFGTLVNVKGAVLTIVLRDGRLLQVDATQAYALNRVAEPFFRGKPVVVDGTLGPANVLHATLVKRGVPDRANWGLDR
jgi:hypothetical protein